jgi:hypothetical protein
VWLVLTDAGSFFAMSNRSCSLRAGTTFYALELRRGMGAL